MWSFGHCVFAHLGEGNKQDEPGRGAAGVAVEVPLAVHLPGQRLVGDVAHQPLGQAQAHLLPQRGPLQLTAALEDGPPEAVGALAAHLQGDTNANKYLNKHKQIQTQINRQNTNKYKHRHKHRKKEV